VLLPSRRTRKAKQTIVAGLLSRHDDSDGYPFNEPDFDPEDLEQILEQPRDTFVDSAKEDLKKFFAAESESVYYQRQLQVMFEGKYFHWITVRALSELVQEGKLGLEVVPLSSGTETPTATISFYRSTTYRYWKRDADEIVSWCLDSPSQLSRMRSGHRESCYSMQRCQQWASCLRGVRFARIGGSNGRRRSTTLTAFLSGME
jgi:hypothetical protein